jgi:hypothetical protein
MRRLLGVLTISAAALVGFAGAGHASWVSDHCYPDHMTDYYVKRSDARAYADVARNEGYEWGGGCWNNNDRDDTPNAPDSGGEGPDCSGLVFKTWELVNASGKSGFTWYNKLENVHGPYSSYDFHSPDSTDPFFRISKARSTTVYMDAFAKNGHVGMLWTSANPSAYTDYIVEARGDDAGTNVFVRDYRYNDAYTGVRREGWTPDCYPYCQIASRQLTVVVP